LPKVSTSLVGKALNFVIELMPLDLGRQLHGSWYTRRHAPGPSLSPAAEWDIFCKCILEKCGYQVGYFDDRRTVDREYTQSKNFGEIIVNILFGL
jgi:hypothetical protein